MMRTSYVIAAVATSALAGAAYLATQTTTPCPAAECRSAEFRYLGDETLEPVPNRYPFHSVRPRGVWTRTDGTLPSVGFGLSATPNERVEFLDDCRPADGCQLLGYYREAGGPWRIWRKVPEQPQ